ncbi:MAG: TetR/AcrR family transcriptional regulator [Pseudomonadales bacterium]|nr:TetR/AcrR family transcriptional regulator [Pseudomonadales bacterium]MBO6564988.1 TetR/AcrR family transcriptional regulator [Pseudomonadales bacterium]MBO6595625.1 TetR/AcrR family transcriptional regulator [Pseudomonadales bacterium]MBO6655694.1 TetR/AcrR family transcriptional regulator [Pseudomonadales bacterium]MBO6702125.1 TetR/AcrR family transcriptional regulator [Pseudomonadales bacterium]
MTVSKSPSRDADRERYHHGDLRQAILTAACEYLKTENADTLSLRALAREIGVSQTAPYRHFDSRNALFAGIATWGFEILEKEMETCLAGQLINSTDAMIEMGLTYLSFSETHAEKYQLFFDSSMVDFDEYPDLQDASGHCFDILLETIKVGQRAGLYRIQPVEQLAAQIWSGLHGIASLLQLSGKRPNFLEKPTGRAIHYLAEDRRQVLRNLVNTIRV